MTPRQAERLVAACGSNMENLRQALVAFYRTRGGARGRPSIAIVARPGDAQIGELRRLAEHFRQMGHEVANLVPAECEPERWELLYRHVWAHNTPPESPFARALRAPSRHVLANPVNGMLEAKALFARLSECAEDPRLSSLAGLDEVELSAGPSPRLRRELDDLGARCGVGAGEDGVFVLDEDGIVRFAQAPSGELTWALAGALEAAGRELLGLPPRSGITRRDWAVMSLVAGFGLVLFQGCRGRGPERPAPVAAKAGTEVDVVLRINGQDRRLRIDARVSLLDALREQLSLTGTRKGCDHGQCGACTVLRDGRAVNACLTLAVAAEGAEITTIEGLARGDQLHPVQAAFIAHDAFQCGYCTSGQILTAVALLGEGRPKTDDEVRQQMSGNLCRCGAYPNIIAAIQAARREV